MHCTNAFLVVSHLHFFSNLCFRLHEELWDNQANELNDGPVCRCSIKARKIGIRHGIYQGEDSLPKVEMKPHSNNADTLYHYR